ncbi:MAG: signal peptidase II [Polyangiaceae bacterium]|jgi:signal peptidase II
MKRTSPSRLAVIASLVSLVGCDHASKVAAEATLRNRAPVVVVPGMIDLSYAENRDVAFGALSRLSLRAPAWLLAALACLAIGIFIAWWLRGGAAGWSEPTAFAMIAAGGIGNAAERAIRGHVIDFIHVCFWPVFNVADVLIVVGLVLLVVRRCLAARVLRTG